MTTAVQTDRGVSFAIGQRPLDQTSGPAGPEALQSLRHPKARQDLIWGREDPCGLFFVMTVFNEFLSE